MRRVGLYMLFHRELILIIQMHYYIFLVKGDLYCYRFVYFSTSSGYINASSLIYFANCNPRPFIKISSRVSPALPAASMCKTPAIQNGDRTTLPSGDDFTICHPKSYRPFARLPTTFSTGPVFIRF